MDWKREIAIAHLVKNKIAEADVGGLWENTLPNVAATPDQVQALERQLGYAIHPQHREFLLHADGWRAFMHNIDVFGTDDFVGGPRAAAAIELIESLEDLEPLCGFGERDLLPIAVNMTGIDVMLMTRPHTATPGKVFWLAGGVVDTFPDFQEWFLAMVDYNRNEYQRLVKAQQQ